MTPNLSDELVLQRMLIQEFTSLKINNIFYNKKNKYYYVASGKTLTSVHRAVAKSTLRNPDGYGDVNHKDSDRANNYPTNLEWCTRSYNIKHSYEAGRVGPSMGKFGKDHGASKPIKGVHKDTGETVYFDSLADARRVGFSPSKICVVAKGHRPHHRGYKWSYM